MRGWVCRHVTACRRRRAVTGPRRMFASHECVGACRDGGNRVHTVDDCANLAWSAAATLSCLRRLSGELEQRTNESSNKMFAQSGRVC